MKKALLMLLFLVLIGGGAVFSLARDWQKPVIELPQAEYVNHTMVVTARDNRALGQVCYSLDGKVETCSDADGSAAFELTVDLSSLADGEQQVCITATDANRFLPNRASQCRTYILDKVPPKGALEAATRYMRRGGAAAAFVATAEPETNLHVRVGEHRFPFISNADLTRHFAVFAHPYDLEVADFKPVVEITDRAGNVRRLPVGTVSQDRSFKTDTLNIPHAFIESKSLEMLNREGRGKEGFLEMNRTLRVANREQISAITSVPEKSEPRWQGVFFRNPGAPMAQFAERRTYLLDNEPIDQQTHEGLDIAGLAAMPIKAANHGVVTFADYIGIYGNCVIIDHGSHVFTLYAHLSQIDVTPGTRVTREQVIGRSGKTGMAGGDHLHYGAYVFNVPVEPTEWFDPAWVQTRIDDIYQAYQAGQ